MSDFWDDLDLDDLDVELDKTDSEIVEALAPPAPAPPKPVAAPAAPVPGVAKKAAPQVPGQAPQGAAKPTQDPQVPNLPKLPKMPAGMELPEFKTSKHKTDDILDKFLDALDRADSQEDEPSLNAALAIADKYLAMATFLGQKELEIEQAKFQAQFDLIKNAQEIAQIDAENKQKLKHNEDYHKQKLKHGDETNKVRMQAQKDAIAQRRTGQATPAKKAPAAKKAAPPRSTPPI